MYDFSETLDLTRQLRSNYSIGESYSFFVIDTIFYRKWKKFFFN